MKAGHKAFHVVGGSTSSQRWETNAKPALVFLTGKGKYTTRCNKNHFFAGGLEADREL